LAAAPPASIPPAVSQCRSLNLVDLAVDGETSYAGDIQDFGPIRPNIFQSATIPPD
jgi:hypothetical protein